jgi:hypothetical protein
MSIETFLAAASAGQEVVSIPSASEKRPSNTAGSVPAGGTVMTWICSAGMWASHRWTMRKASVIGARVSRCEARKAGQLRLRLRFSYGVRAQVGQFDGLHVAPDQFHRVEVVGVRGSSSATSQDRWPASQAVMALDL